MRPKKTMLEENQKILGLHHPSEISTVGGFESGGRLYRIAVHGSSLNDFEEPHFHIYLDTEEGLDYLNPPFNFEISLMDFLSKDELNFMSQTDKERDVRYIIDSGSWEGYEDLRIELRNFFNNRLNSKRMCCFRDNLDFLIHIWNEQHDFMYEQKGINPLKEYFTNHNIPILDKYKIYFEP